jgi:hypothetical protein
VLTCLIFFSVGKKIKQQLEISFNQLLMIETAIVVGTNLSKVANGLELGLLAM